MASWPAYGVGTKPNGTFWANVKAYIDDLFATAPSWVTVSTYGTNVTATANGSFFAPAYCKLANGFVVLRGEVRATGAVATNGVLFTLPVGFRPTKIQRFLSTGSATGTILVNPDGTVTTEQAMTSAQVRDLDGTSWSTS